MPAGLRPATFSLVLSIDTLPGPRDGAALVESARTALGLLDGHRATATWALAAPGCLDDDALDAIIDRHDVALTGSNGLTVAVSRADFSRQLAADRAAWQDRGVAPAAIAIDETATLAHTDALFKQHVAIVCRKTAPAARKGLARWLWSSRAEVPRPRPLRWGVWQVEAMDVAGFGAGMLCRAIDAAIAARGHLVAVVCLEPHLTESLRRQFERVLRHAAAATLERRLCYATLGQLPALLLPGRHSPPAHSALRRAA